MKTGKTIVLVVYSQQAKAVNFSIPLSGFAGALAGKGLDAEGFKKLQEARAAELKARAEKARDAMVKAQRDQAGEGRSRSGAVTLTRPSGGGRPAS